MTTVTWPGSDDEALASAVTEILPGIGIPAESAIVISGARAPAIATGIRVNRPDLSVWVVTCAQDALALGGGHLIGALLRNVSLKIVVLADGTFDPVPMALGVGATFVARTLEDDREHLAGTLAAAAAHEGAALVAVCPARDRPACGRPGCDWPVRDQPGADAARAPVGVLRAVRHATFDERFRQSPGTERGDLQQLLLGSDGPADRADY